MAKDLPEKLTVQSILGVRTITDDYCSHQMSVEVFDEIIRRCKAYEGLVDVLIGDGPFPIIPCLAILADAADHLLKDHNCDSHNYEQVGNVAIVARQRIGEIKQALSEKVEE